MSPNQIFKLVRKTIFFWGKNKNISFSITRTSLTEFCLLQDGFGAIFLAQRDRELLPRESSADGLTSTLDPLESRGHFRR